MKMFFRYRELINEAEKKVLSEEYDIILCTCNETCSGRLLRFANKSKQSQDTSSRLSHCIIDECGMATEPEAMAAASLCEHVVLIGDHKQLQPIIHYQPASESGLSISMFERYANKSTKLLVRLNVQYRMVSFLPIILIINKITNYSMRLSVHLHPKYFMMDLLKLFMIIHHHG